MTEVKSTIPAEIAAVLERRAVKTLTTAGYTVAEATTILGARPTKTCREYNFPVRGRGARRGMIEARLSVFYEVAQLLHLKGLAKNPRERCWTKWYRTAAGRVLPARDS